ncbi:hypothetical protein AB0J52_10675 [Spirillospora sp. NPDC049652]
MIPSSGHVGPDLHEGLQTVNRNATQARAGVTGAVMALAPHTGPGPGSRPGPGDAPFASPPPLPGVAGHLLSGVAAGPSGVWVVGSVGQKPLAARWDGTSWTVLPDPSESSLASAVLLGARLRGVAHVFAAAPGRDGGAAASRQAEAARKSAGPASDSVLTNPASLTNPGSGATPTTAARADGETVIAVGGAYDRLERVDVALVRHWTGTAWTAWEAPHLLRGIVLNAVAPAGEGCAWAVGHATPHGPRALRWGGTNWEPSDVPDIPHGRLVAVAAFAPDDVWAVGSAGRDGLLLHFDGRNWSRVPSPAKGPLTGVSASAPGEVWAVGHNAVLRWDGRRWSRVRTPLSSANTVTARASDDVWIAGGEGGAAHYDGHAWTVHSAPEPAVWLASASAPDRTLWLAGTRAQEHAPDTPDSPAVTAQPKDA